MQRDVPRLTGVLRVALSGREAVDLAKEATARERQLRDLQKVLQVAELGGEGQLTWQKFVEGIEEPDEARLRKMRATYNLFLAELKDVVGDENLSSGELHEMAFLVYQVFADSAKPIQQKASALGKLLRDSPAKKAVDALAGHVAALAEWKEAVTVLRTEESVTSKMNRKEYGAHLLFSFDPPDFFSREARVISKTSELVKLPSQNQQQQSQQPKLQSSKAELVKPKGNWLQDECERYLDQSGSSTNATDVYKSIVAVAKSAQSAEAMQGQLFDLLGAEGLDLMGLVVEKWAAVKSLPAPSKGGFSDGANAANSLPQSAYAPSPGNMSVTLESDKKSQQQRRKQEKKQRMAAGAMSGAAETQQLEHYARVIEEGDRSALPAAARDDYVAGGVAHAMETKFHMPEGAKRVDNPDYESVWLPPKFSTYRDDSDLIPVALFEPWARNAFKGFEKLNRIQSAVFPSAYRSNENLLICAPTGAGKTNIAMLAILREIGRNMVDGVLQKDKFKIVYVAPMKALASEMTAGFGGRLAYLGISVRELTGDMQLTKTEIEETQIIVTTPEKWDVITRKSTDSPLTQIVHLLIFDEVHLLNEDRGPVIETLVARTLRQVESTQSMIRIVGLSATLPNYKDVAQFMRVNESSGLHYFDGSYRPVPLEQTFVGVKPKGFQKQREVMTNYCYETIIQTLKKGKQCLVFVHSRRDTVKTAQDLLQLAEEKGKAELFSDEVMNGKHAEWARKEVNKSRNSDVKRLFLAGFAIHHAGMLRGDRNLVEKMFHQGLIKVLVCTATLAWGVNLPAHQGSIIFAALLCLIFLFSVLIKGTQVYNAEKGKFCSLGMLDVMQIFGRAGRPQFDDQGSAVMITTHDELYRYLALTSHQAPIESQFVKGLEDNLNAEIVLGTVTNIQEAVAWLSYTYLFVRMLCNPMVYGISYEERSMDPNLVQKRTELIVAAANELDDVRMIRFNNPYFASTNLGQTSSHYYICHETIRTFNETFEKKSNSLTLADVFRLISNASEFENMVSREEEMSELDKMKTLCPVEIKGDAAGDKTVKVNILLQSYISMAPVNAFALVCDTNFVAQNAGRISRGLFEIALRKGLPDAASLLLKVCKMIELRIWDTMHPLRQFSNLSVQVVAKFEERGLSVDRLMDMEPGEISAITRVPAVTPTVISCLEQIPYLDVETSVQPITRTIIRIRVTLRPNFRWNDRLHGQMQPFWIWVENPVEVGILHHEYFLLRKKENRQASEIVFTTPISHPVPPQYILHVCSDRWLGSDNSVPLSFKHLILPQLYPPHTQLLDLQPLPITALQNPLYQSIFRYEYFNPIQTQIFHTIYHTDQNVLLGAPTGSGKTVAAELAVMRLFNHAPHLKAVYLGPLKALVQERLKDWGTKFVDKMGKKMVELTGEFTPDVLALKQADIICTTPEKWDGVSRSWQNRGYVTLVGLIIIDEIHLLGEDRGPILEVIVSRMRHIASQTQTQVRVIGLSTALANAKDLADWLGIQGPGLFNFHPSVRPVPLKIHVQGYEGAAYCPRMAKMNRPAYAAILSYSPTKPVLIFVSSRRQTRLTAMDIISHVAGDGQPKRFIIGDDNVLQRAIGKIRDANLKHCLSFGIGLHHAGLPRDDRALVEELFDKRVIQVLISTATLAWGVNLPAHCFADDHEVLTNEGFVGVAQLRERWDVVRGEFSDGLKFVAYDERADAYIHESASHFIDRNVNDSPLMKISGNGIEFLVTGGHDMYVERMRQDARGVSRAVNGGGFAKVAAEDLLPGGSVSEMRMKLLATNGLIDADIDWPNLSFRVAADRPDFLDALQLSTYEEVCAFIEVYGFWLGDGTLTFVRQYGMSRIGADALRFCPRREHEFPWLMQRIAALRLRHHVSDLADGRVQVDVVDDSWFVYFVRAYGIKYDLDNVVTPLKATVSRDVDMDGPHASKWFLSWVWLLSRTLFRCLLNGLRIADGFSRAPLAAEVVEKVKRRATTDDSVTSHELNAIRSFGKGARIYGEDNLSVLTVLGRDFVKEMREQKIEQTLGAMLSAKSENVTDKEFVSVTGLTTTQMSEALVTGEEPRVLTASTGVHRVGPGADKKRDRDPAMENWELAGNHGSIATSSVRFRDEVVRLCLLAGFSAYFTPDSTEGAGLLGGKDSINGIDAWRVIYDVAAEGDDLLKNSSDVSTERYSGAVWCVTVPSGLLCVRRIKERDAVSGAVLEASKPTVVGNCVIIKGGEYYDAKTHRYVDYAVTDMLQMMGRAGRPQYDDSGEAVIMCTSAMKGFYKKFLYEPFPVESSLADVLHDHLNAEIVAGTLTTKHDAVDWMTWTYLYRRILVNPTYYGLDASDLPSVNKFLSNLVDETLHDLESSHCIELDDDGTTIWALTMGKIVSYYYLNHKTAGMFFTEIDERSDLARLLQILCSAKEYEELPVRHNEDGMNEELAGEPGVVHYELQSKDWENPGVKANLLLQCHFGRAQLPISDYITDQKSVLDQAIRILQAMVDVSADGGWLWTTLHCMHLMQMVSQAQFLDETALKQIGIEKDVGLFLPELVGLKRENQKTALEGVGGDKALNILSKLPLVELSVTRNKPTEVMVRATKVKGSSTGAAHAPFFPKQKREGWWIVIGDSEEGELYALKRITMQLGKPTNCKLELDEEQATSKNMWVYCISDSYIGLDCQARIA